MSSSAFVRFKPFLRFLSFIGIFPCSIGEDGTLKSISQCKLYTKWLIYELLCASFLGITLWNMIAHLGMDFLKTQAELFSNELDLYALIVPVIANTMLGYIIMWKMYDFGKGFCCLENLIKDMGPKDLCIDHFWANLLSFTM